MTILQLLLVCCCAWQSSAFVPNNNKNNNNKNGRFSTQSHFSSLQHRSLLFQQRRYNDFYPNGSNSTTYSPQQGRQQAWSSTSSPPPPPPTSRDGRFFKRDVSQVPGDRSYVVSPEFYSAASARANPPPVYPTEDWLSRDDSRRHNERGTWKKPDFADASLVDDDDDENNMTTNSSSSSAWLNATLNHPVHFADDWWKDHPRALKLELSRFTEQDPQRNNEPPFFNNGGGGTNAPYFYGNERAPPPPYYFLEDPSAYYQNAPYNNNNNNYYGDRSPNRMYSSPNSFDNPTRGNNNDRSSPADQGQWNRNSFGQQQRRQQPNQGMSRPRPGSQDMMSRSTGTFRKTPSTPPPFFQNFRQRVTSSPRDYQNGSERRNDRSSLSANGVRRGSSNNNNNNGESSSSNRYEPVLLSERLKQGMGRGARDRSAQDGGMGTPMTNRPVLLNDKLRRDRAARGGYYNEDRGFRGDDSSYYYSNGDQRGLLPYYEGGNGSGFSRGYQPMRREEGWSIRGSSGLMNQGMYYGTGNRGYGSTYSYGSERGFSPYYNQYEWGNQRMSSRSLPVRLDEAWSGRNQLTQSNGLKRDMSRMSSDRVHESSYFYGGANSNQGLTPYYNGGRNSFYGNGNGNGWSSNYYYQDGNYRSSSPYLYGSGNDRSFSPYYYQGGNERRHYSPFNPRGDLMTSSTSYYPGGGGFSSYSPFSQSGNMMSSSYYQGGSYGDSYSKKTSS